MQEKVSQFKTDPITVEVIKNFLVTTCREMGIAMMHASYSPMFNEALDFSCVIFDSKPEMIAQAEFCPAQIGAIRHTVKWCIKEVNPQNLNDGDVVLTNDPYRGGCHLPEFLVVKPCFYNGEIIAYTANIAHMTDVGGMAPACFGTQQNIFQEGLRLPPVKIYINDKENEDIFDIVCSNVRTPKNSYGDLKAMIGSLYLAEQRIKELVEKYGIDVFRQATEDIKNVSERKMREEISKMPDGEWESDGFLEDDGVVPDKMYKIKVRIILRGDEIIVDYTGSSRQALGPPNQTFGVTASATYNAIFHLLGTEIDFNEGCYRPITIIAPPGSFVNVNYPGACVGGNSDTHPTTVNTLMYAFSKILPERISAMDGGTCGCIAIGGVHPDTGEPFAHLHLDGVGWGGRVGHDGNDSVFVKNGNCGNTPVEVYESRYPVLIEEYMLQEGSAGAGKYRGGYGTRRKVKFLADIIVSAHTNYHVLKPQGVFGGKLASNAQLKFRCGDSTEFRTSKEQFNAISLGKFINLSLHSGDELLWISPGGGGYGDPLERDPTLVLKDFIEGRITLREVREDYGVVIDPEKRAVNMEKTTRLRRRMRDAHQRG